MPYRLLQKDIAKMKADIIVSPANTKPICSPGLEMELYAAAGADRMLDARREVGSIPVGQAAYTNAFGLKADYVIHVVPPIWKGGDDNEFEQIHQCYQSIFSMARQLNCTSIAVPLLMSDVYLFPKRKALDIAMSEINHFLREKDIMVDLVVCNVEEIELPQELITRIDEVLGIQKVNQPVSVHKTIDEVLEVQTESFGERLFRLIDEKHYTDVEVYKRANVDRRIISKLRTKPDKHINKNTALALAIGLRLNLDETKELIELAGYAISPRYRFDRIVQFYIESENYNIIELNEVLFSYTKKTLGG